MQHCVHRYYDMTARRKRKSTTKTQAPEVRVPFCNTFFLTPFYYVSNDSERIASYIAKKAFLIEIGANFGEKFSMAGVQNNAINVTVRRYYDPKNQKPIDILS